MVKALPGLAPLGGDDPQLVGRVQAVFATQGIELVARGMIAVEIEPLRVEEPVHLGNYGPGGAERAEQDVQRGGSR
jgi:hypothetical protein